ncbi:MAG: hypothetical protein HY689_10015 [Chloroflexi bacterium]|nr:hypothetical protein [Chloroflexota bacterium]
MIQGKTKQWDILTQPENGGVYAVRWVTLVCRECRNEYLRYWEGPGVPQRLVVGPECFHVTEDQWPPDFRRSAVAGAGV